MPKHLLLFAATTGYQIRVFADAARRLGVGVTLATDRCHIMDDPWGDNAVPVKFDRVAESLAVLRDCKLAGGWRGRGGRYSGGAGGSRRGDVRRTFPPARGDVGLP